MFATFWCCVLLCVFFKLVTLSILISTIYLQGVCGLNMWMTNSVATFVKTPWEEGTMNRESSPGLWVSTKFREIHQYFPKHEYPRTCLRDFEDDKLVEETVVFTFPASDFCVSAGQVLKIWNIENADNFEEECFNMQSSIWERVCRSSQDRASPAIEECWSWLLGIFVSSCTCFWVANGSKKEYRLFYIVLWIYTNKIM